MGDVRTVRVCANAQCRVLHFTSTPTAPRCPACYGEGAATTEVIGK